MAQNIMVCGVMINITVKVSKFGVMETSKIIYLKFQLKYKCRYEGDWYLDSKQGQGNYVWASGDKYEGEWFKDEHNGYGVFQWSSGAKYIGKFKGNTRNDDHGIFEWPNGDKYEGGFKDDVLEGEGTYIYDCGDKFVGEWKGKIS